MNDIKLYPNFHSIDTDKKYCIVLGGRGCGKTYSQEQYLRSHYPISFLKDFYKVCNCSKKQFDESMLKWSQYSEFIEKVTKETINSIYGRKEGSGEMKRYKLSYEIQNGNGCWIKYTLEKDGEGYAEEELLTALAKGYFDCGALYRHIKIEEIIPKSELFEELFFIQYRVFGKQNIEVDFFTNFRDFCYHIVKISSDLGDILNADKITAAQRGICGGFFQNVKHNKKFNDLYNIIDIDGKKYFRGLKG